MPERALEVNARVLEALPSALYCLELETSSRPRVTAHVLASAGLLRVRPGDRVVVELMSEDRSRGRIVRRRSPVSPKGRSER